MSAHPGLATVYIDAATPSQMLAHCKAAENGLNVNAQSMRQLGIWHRLNRIQEKLDALSSQHWMLVLDGLNELSMPEFASWCRQPLPPFGSILLTTQRWDIADAFRGISGRSVRIFPLNPHNAASLLAQNAVHDKDLIYDHLAHQLEYSPRSVTQAYDTLRRTDITPTEFNSCLQQLLEASRWSRGNIVTEAGQTYPRIIDDHPAASNKTLMLHLRTVILACEDPAWTDIFDHLQNSIANDVISMLSILGLQKISRACLVKCTTNDGDAMVKKLLDYNICFPSPDPHILQLSGLMMLARRLWLLRRGMLAQAHQNTLGLIAQIYPDVSVEHDGLMCQEMEPFAKRALHDASRSWSEGNAASRNAASHWSRVMLLNKRSAYFDRIVGDKDEAVRLKRLADNAYSEVAGFER